MQAMQWVRAALAALLISAPTAAFGQPNCRNTGAVRALARRLQEGGRGARASRKPRSRRPRPTWCSTSASSISTADRNSSRRTSSRFSDKMLAGGRLPSGADQIKKHQALFAREEKEFGVPASVITAFWGLESDFGAGQGKDHAIKSLATLAYDCRRSDMFRGHAVRRAAHDRARRPARRGDDRLVGGRARPDPDDAVGIHGARRRLRRRRPAQPDQERAGRDRLDRKISRRISAGSAASRGCRRCASRQPAVEGGRPVGPASALEMGGSGA